MQTISKCNEIWTKCNRPKAAEQIKSVLNGSFLTPTITRWNSMFDAIKRIIKYESKINDVCEILKTTHFANIDFDYIKEYIQILEPISLALDFLQSDGIFYGFLLPTLVTLKLKYQKLILLNNTKIIKQAIIVDLLSAIHKRFEAYYLLNSESYGSIIASVCHPEVKMKWFNVISQTAEIKTKHEIYQIVLSEMQTVECKNCVEATNSSHLLENSSSFLDYGIGKKIFYIRLLTQFL